MDDKSDFDLGQHGEWITALEEAFVSLKENIGELSSSLRVLSAQLANIGRANYPLYIAAVTLTITLVAAVLYPFVQNIRELKEADKNHSERMAHLETEEAVIAERVAWVRKLAEGK